MSQVFLSSSNRDDVTGFQGNMPYKFTNSLTNPLRLKPNSQVALVSAGLAGSADFVEENDANEPQFFVMGNPALNMSVEVVYDPLAPSPSNYANNLARDMNAINPNSNFTCLNQTDQVIGGRTQVSVGNRGWSIYVKDDEKSDIRVTQHNVVYDEFHQLWNNGHNGQPAGLTYGAYTPPSGFNLGTGATKIDPTFNFLGATLNVGNPLGTIGSNQIDDLTQHANTGPTNDPRFTDGGFLGPLDVQQNFYNIPFGTAFTNSTFGGGAGPGTPSGGPNNKISVYDGNYFELGTEVNPNGLLDVNDNDLWMCQPFTHGIQRTVGTMTPNIANNQVGNGHQAIGHLGSGGYMVFTTASNRMFNTANGQFTFQPAGSGGLPLPADQAGFTGIRPHYMGVLPHELLYGFVQGNNPANIGEHTRAVDINNAGAVVSDPINFERDQARARYLFGYKCFTDVPNSDVIIQAQVLQPDPNVDNASMLNSSYINIGTRVSLRELAMGIFDGNNFEPNWTPASAGGTGTINPIQLIPTGGTEGCNIFFRMRWSSPYTMALEFMLSVVRGGVVVGYNGATDEPYAPANPTHKDPLTAWCLIADMRVPDVTTGQSYYIPTYLGEMIPIKYSCCFTDDFTTKGYYFPKPGWYGGRINAQTGQIREIYKQAQDEFPPLKDDDFWKERQSGSTLYYDQSTMGEGVTYTSPVLADWLSENPGAEVETFDAEGRCKFEIYMQNNEVLKTGEIWKQFRHSNGVKYLDPVNPYQSLHGMLIGYQFGWVAFGSTESGIQLNNDIDATGTDFELWGLNGAQKVVNGLGLWTYHIQLDNLPIQSQNGVIGSQNKTIYVLQLTDEDANTRTANYLVYGHYAPALQWVDLNNYAPIELNTLSVSIKNRLNKVSDDLGLTTNIVVVFRQKPGDSRVGDRSTSAQQPMMM